MSLVSVLSSRFAALLRRPGGNFASLSACIWACDCAVDTLGGVLGLRTTGVGAWARDDVESNDESLLIDDRERVSKGAEWEVELPNKPPPRPLISRSRAGLSPRSLPVRIPPLFPELRAVLPSPLFPDPSPAAAGAVPPPKWVGNRSCCV